MLKIALCLKVVRLTGAVLVLAGLCSWAPPLVHASGSDGLVHNVTPVTITALCQEAGGTPAWRIANPNSNDITLTWGAADQPAIIVPYGFTTVRTVLDANDDATTVTFHQGGVPDMVLPMNQTPCQAPAVSCVDGLTRANLTYTFEGDGTATLRTSNGMPLCADVTVYLSTYTVSKTYDESGFFDDSALPEQRFSSTSTVMHEGTNATVTLTTAIPNACTDYQLDLYYAPEVTTITSYLDMGAQLIDGEMHLHTATNCMPAAPAATSGRGGGQVLAASTVASAPTLADTGDSTIVPALSALALMTVAVFVQFPLFGRAQKRFVK